MTKETMLERLQKEQQKHDDLIKDLKRRWREELSREIEYLKKSTIFESHTKNVAYEQAITDVLDIIKGKE